MELQPYLAAVADDLLRATALADDHTRDITARVALAVEPALRLALMQALADAAATITTQLDGAVVTVRVEGRDPVIVVQDIPVEQAAHQPDVIMASSVQASEDGDLARVTVRLPEHLKRQAESMASDASQSLNTWINQAIREAAAPPLEPARNRGHSRRVTGWA